MSWFDEALGIPWGLVRRDQVMPLAWTAAALAASAPAAFAAILWVKAWRGTPRFGAPCCRSCGTALRGQGAGVPERCPECGRATSSAGRTGDDVDFGRRRWSWWTALRTAVLGAVLVATAAGVAGLAGAHVHRQVRFATITSYTEAIDPTLRQGRLGPAILGALRFASDAAPNDESVRAAVLPPLRAFLDGDIAADRGLGLLLDGLGSPNDATPIARVVVVDIVGSLVARGDLDEAEGRAIVERVTGGPRAIVRRRSPIGVAPMLSLVGGSTFATVELSSVSLGGEPLEVRTVERGASGWSDRFGGAFPVAYELVDGLPLGRHELELRWTSRLMPSPDVDPDQKPWSVREHVDRVAIDVVPADDAAPGPIERPDLATPLLAREQTPIVDWTALGPLRTVQVTLQAPLHPGVALAGRLVVVIDGERHELAPIAAAGGLLRSIDTALLPERARRPDRVRVVFEPDPAALGRRTELRTYDGLWQRPIVWDDVPVRRASVER
jgi:hypothetical protein